MFNSTIHILGNMFTSQITRDPLWGIIGLVGQAVFGSRFVLQWLASEYKKQSHVPTMFWYLSLVGSLLLLAYSIHKQDIIFILGFSLNTFIYLRNLHLIYQNSKAKIIPQPEDNN